MQEFVEGVIMKKNILETIVSCMATHEEMFNIQKVQTEHRIKLVESWGIKEGSRVLEIGCGQGDTTAVLAYFVGETGFVQGIDVAAGDYGAPITLGDSLDFLKNSKLGKQIKIDLETDILSSDFDYPEQSFDYIVFSQCSWYLSSFEELQRIMEKVKNWGKQLCFAEWDARIKSIEQYPHLLSIQIQAQYEAFKQGSDSNVRTLFTPDDLKKIVKHAGWNVIKEEIVDSPELQDGKWEMDKVVTDIEFEFDKTKDMPVKMKELIESEVKLLQEFMKSHVVKPLSVYSFTAV